MDWSETEKYLGLFYSASYLSVEEKGWVAIDNSHISDCLGLAYCVYGEEELMIDGKLHRFVPGMTRIVPPTSHSDEELKIRTLKPSMFIDVGFITKNPFVTKTTIIDSRNNRKIYDKFQDLVKVSVNGGMKRFFEGTSVFFLLLQELVQLMDEKAAVEEAVSKQLRPAVDFICDNYTHKDLVLNDLPKMCGMKSNLFYKEFHKQYERTPSDFVTNLRMQRAVELLFYTELSINEIAEKTGYESASYFGRVFKKHFGTSPSRYITKKDFKRASLIKQ